MVNLPNRLSGTRFRLEVQNGQFFSEIGISALDVVEISASFVLTMLIFFGIKDKKYRWLNYSSLGTFVLLCILFILFRNGLNVKLFAALMLMSTLIVEAVVTRRRKLEAREQSASSR